MRVLKEYIQQVLEIRRDEKFIASLKGHKDPTVAQRGKKVAGEWLSHLEMSMGGQVKKEDQQMVIAFVGVRFPELLKTYKGNEQQARQAMLQLLDYKFSMMRVR